MSVGWSRGPGLGELDRVFGPDVIEAVIDKTGCREVRSRRLPAHLMVAFTLARALWCPDPYREVLRRLHPAGAGPAPADKAAVFRARLRVGVAPMAELLAQVGPQAVAASPGAFFHGRHLMVLDGTTVKVADHPANVAAFGRPGSGKGPAAYPVVKVMALIESGTHVVVDAGLGGCRDAERELAGPLLRRLAPGDLLIADAGIPSVPICRIVTEAGADALFRVPATWALVPAKILPDGSYLAVAKTATSTPAARRDTMTVRVIEYRLADPGRDGSIRYRLITTITDPQQAPAAELAALYAERWEAETTLAEIKTAQIGPGQILPSKHPDLVRQEIYAHLAVHAGIRALMHHAALAGPVPIDPDRLSFTAALRAVRRSMTGGPAIFPPNTPPKPDPDRRTPPGDQPAPPAAHRDPALQTTSISLPPLETRPPPAGPTHQDTR